LGGPPPGYGRVKRYESINSVLETKSLQGSLVDCTHKTGPRELRLTGAVLGGNNEKNREDRVKSLFRLLGKIR